MDTTEHNHQWKECEKYLTEAIVNGELKKLINLRREYQNNKADVFAQNAFLEAQRAFLNDARRQGVYDQICELLNHLDSAERLGEFLK